MTTSSSPSSAELSDIAIHAKGALERICSGAGLDSSSRYYSPAFVDHVNNLEFDGLAGVQQSVDLYTSVLSGIQIRVEEQLVDGLRVTSRFVVAGTCYGRRVSFNGITISRFENALIIEDWSVTDSLSMLRQLGWALNVGWFAPMAHFEKCEQLKVRLNKELCALGGDEANSPIRFRTEGGMYVRVPKMLHGNLDGRDCPYPSARE